MMQSQSSSNLNSKKRNAVDLIYHERNKVHRWKKQFVVSLQQQRNQLQQRLQGIENTLVSLEETENHRYRDGDLVDAVQYNHGGLSFWFKARLQDCSNNDYARVRFLQQDAKLPDLLVPYEELSDLGHYTAGRYREEQRRYYIQCYGGNVPNLLNQEYNGEYDHANDFLDVIPNQKIADVSLREGDTVALQLSPDLGERAFFMEFKGRDPDTHEILVDEHIVRQIKVSNYNELSQSLKNELKNISKEKEHQHWYSELQCNSFVEGFYGHDWKMCKLIQKGKNKCTVHDIVQNRNIQLCIPLIRPCQSSTQ